MYLVTLKKLFSFSSFKANAISTETHSSVIWHFTSFDFLWVHFLILIIFQASFIQCQYCKRETIIITYPISQDICFLVDFLYSPSRLSFFFFLSNEVYFVMPSTEANTHLLPLSDNFSITTHHLWHVTTNRINIEKFMFSPLLEKECKIYYFFVKLQLYTKIVFAKLTILTPVAHS